MVGVPWFTMWLSIAASARAEDGPVAPPADSPAPEAPADEAPADPESPAPEAPAPEARRTMAAPSLPPPPPPEDELPIPTLTIDRIPPSTSFEFAVQVSYGEVSYHRASVPPWVGFGFRGGWGKNFGTHRLGASALLTAEGDIGVHSLFAFEPHLAYDVVTSGGLLLGLGAGPSFIHGIDASTIQTERSTGVVPAAEGRVGWSQTWSRIGRRLFVFAEPKVRYVEGAPDLLVAVAVGSGSGR